MEDEDGERQGEEEDSEGGVIQEEGADVEDEEKAGDQLESVNLNFLRQGHLDPVTTKL